MPLPIDVHRTLVEEGGLTGATPCPRVTGRLAEGWGASHPQFSQAATTQWQYLRYCHYPVAAKLPLPLPEYTFFIRTRFYWLRLVVLNFLG